MYSGNQLRELFLKFFEAKGHRRLPSASLIPRDDPTLLLTVAGMVPFKPYFLRRVEPPFPRATTAQKCVRTPDLEVVGKTARHHTFFEMLGNFSFGDYFKEEAITWAWEFITQELQLSKDVLWVSVHPDDDEARRLWQEKAGVAPERIYADATNLWAAGPVGPCGPCSEIYVDLGESRGCGSQDCSIACDCGRFLEIWNLVFMQYNRDEQGQMTPLPQQNIDTGMGLERIASVMQKVPSNFDTDLFTPLMNQAAEIAGIRYGDDAKNDLALKIIADHSRAVSFMLADGIRPGNEGRGYVLRRILRRAIRYARLLGIQKPFLEQVFRVIQQDYAHHYPELRDNEAFILNHLQIEEAGFQATLDAGTLILQEKARDLQSKGQPILAGADAFWLYETYGFPVELTIEMLEEQEITVDMAGFVQAQEEHRAQAKEHSKSMRAVQVSPQWTEQIKQAGQTEFCGYESLCVEARVTGLFWADAALTEVAAEQEAYCFLDQSPFYAASGGQIADLGWLNTAQAQAEITEVRKELTGTIVHRVRVIRGVLRVGEMVQAQVQSEWRTAICRHHSATHLLHEALRAVLGEHVQQAGSLVTPERLRFDFTHFAALTSQEMQQVEDHLNEVVWANHTVSTEEMPLEQAKASGATALFGEKYADLVRVVRIGTQSQELCGGTHVRASGEIGLVKILSESGIGAGLRRIEAVAGAEALCVWRDLEEQMFSAAGLLKAQPADLAKRVTFNLNQLKEAEREIQRLQVELAKTETGDLLNQVREVAGIKVLAAQVQAADMESLRNMTDMLRDKLKEGVLVLGAVHEGKVFWVTAVTPPGLSGLHAGKIIKEVAQITGGSGGGKPEMAQAGGKAPGKITEAVAQVSKIVEKMIAK
ncbi:MAG: alanine--tRNA ligase [Peptococcaceae bacterium]|jgi:alanyl-tRNA synthetase|nr:alanine--tRNA ligase [Peptococcaceae bacterium]